jgi:hypothetical protein
MLIGAAFLTYLIPRSILVGLRIVPCRLARGYLSDVLDTQSEPALIYCKTAARVAGTILFLRE